MSVLVPEENREKTPDDSYTNKYQKHVASFCENKLVCVDDKLSKCFRSQLVEDAIKNFIKSMLEESKHCSVVTF